jgi:microcompartment protein CcmL/EutN
MEKDSLGLIETSGLVAAIEAADAGSKAANVSFRGYQRARAGLITVFFLGDVAAVRAAVTAGSAAAKRVGTVISVHVIARPDRQLHGVANAAKPIETLAPSPTLESTVTELPRTKTAEVAPAADGLVVAEDIAASRAGCEVAELPQAEIVPVQCSSQVCEKPAIEERLHQDQPEIEMASNYAGGNGHRPIEEEAGEEALVATRGFSGHKKEKVRKPRSKRKA